MARKNNFKVFLIILLIAIPAGLCVNLFVDLFIPPQADRDDVVFEAIGGDEFLNVTLTGCKKISEENIPDGKISTSDGEFGYYDAKNITYVNVDGQKGYFIVWKTSPDRYDFNTTDDVNQYSSNYLLDEDAKSFIEYSYEDKCVYGVILSSDKIYYSESKFLYTVLGLNMNGFEMSYTPGSGTYMPYYGGGADHYHTVVPDRYTLSRTDPGAYYDHYEYGDNYDIDNYLESEGYD